MKVVDIYLIGKYEYSTQRGNWIFYMTYKGAVMKRSGFVDNAGSHTRTALYGLVEALNRLKEPCDLRIHSKTNLGFTSMQKSKNKDLLVNIQRQLVNAGHLFSHDTEFPTEDIEKWEEDNKRRNGLASSTNKHNDRQEQRRKKAEEDAYDKLIEEQAMQSGDWRAMYSDLMGPSQGCWVPGSGGY